MSIRITEAEILNAMAVAATGKGPDDARTIPEIAAESGYGEKHIRNALRVLQAQGRLQVHRVRRQALDGRIANVPAYTITPAKRKRA